MTDNVTRRHVLVTIEERIAILRLSDPRRRNAMSLRNTSMWNFFDACSISLPLPRDGGLPAGLMLSARNGQDARLFRIAAAAERVLA